MAQGAAADGPPALVIQFTGPDLMYYYKLLMG
ncbi:hypothetical protein XBO1_500001 [Xenorhabdus bovienii str. oregonense]|uniref:Uncharacterized protein n=1 Tax=Xenorhabdus bovienii str. oregonense TaxID=1398202 RepID=A0A077PA99_XENBV|nr:hypothetical protein XBO1_500001 [Xenorhabdus bovienii str. oregonense]